MTVRPISTLITEVGVALADNTSGDITPEDVRISVLNTIDSVLDVSVQKSLFNANTILQATTDDTPVALSVPEQTVVGRITAGNITALTATQLRTLINVQNGATPDQNVFSQIAVSGQSNVVADSATDTLTLVGSGNIAITTNATTDTITIASTGDLVASNNLSDLTNAGTARTNLGVAIGTNVQAYSSILAGTTASFTTALETKLNGVATNADVNTINSVTAGITGANQITNVIFISQANYDAIGTKSASTLYIIVG